jgi:hypothetical protein
MRPKSAITFKRNHNITDQDRKDLREMKTMSKQSKNIESQIKLVAKMGAIGAQNAEAKKEIPDPSAL